jgi:hypothetical protein
VGDLLLNIVFTLHHSFSRKLLARNRGMIQEHTLEREVVEYYRLFAIHCGIELKAKTFLRLL